MMILTYNLFNRLFKLQPRYLCACFNTKSCIIDITLHSNFFISCSLSFKTYWQLVDHKNISSGCYKAGVLQVISSNRLPEEMQIQGIQYKSPVTTDIDLNMFCTTRLLVLSKTICTKWPSV